MRVRANFTLQNAVRDPVHSDGMRTKSILFRVAAVLVGLLPFVFLEVGLRIFGAGGPGDADSLSGFNRHLPLFEQHGAVYRTAKSREPFFSQQEFPVIKPTNGFRIFCFGGSTVHGHPYQSDTAFPKWLELELTGLDPSKSFQAVNCGGVSYASYRLAPLVNEVLSYQPDLIIVMTGENEFLEDRTYQCEKERSAARAWLEDAVHSLRMVSLARSWIRSSGHAPAASAAIVEPQTLSPEIKTRLDERSGYASYHRDGAWHDRVAAQFDDSIRATIAHCRTARVPLLLIKPGSNLRDCPPFKSEHRLNLSPDSERSWETAFDSATARENAASTTAPPDLCAALQQYRDVEKIDNQYALLDWRIARLLDRIGKKTEAFQYYLRARDQDVCPLRTPNRHEQILEQIATETKTPLLDAAALLAAKSPDGIPGNDWYLDHVHPTIGGHQKIAQAIALRLRELGFLSATSIWPENERRQAYSHHLAELSPNYLADGRRRVEWLENWARRQRLAEETIPKDARGWLHAGFRRLDLGDEQGASESFREALNLDPGTAQLLKAHVEELSVQGRPDAATNLLRWMKTLARN
jgi:lysophospholipase L1-like esterase